MGSALNHCGFIDKHAGNRSRTVIQMKHDFLGNDFFTFLKRKEQSLFEMAKGGIAFSNEAKQKIGKKMEVLDYILIFKDCTPF